MKVLERLQSLSKGWERVLAEPVEKYNTLLRIELSKEDHKMHQVKKKQNFMEKNESCNMENNLDIDSEY